MLSRKLFKIYRQALDEHRPEDDAAVFRRLIELLDANIQAIGEERGKKLYDELARITHDALSAEYGERIKHDAVKAVRGLKKLERGAAQDRGRLEGF